jgi:hypothetical protein
MVEKIRTWIFKSLKKMFLEKIEKEILEKSLKSSKGQRLNKMELNSTCLQMLTG